MFDQIDKEGNGTVSACQLGRSLGLDDDQLVSVCVCVCICVCVCVCCVVLCCVCFVDLIVYVRGCV